MGRQANDKTVHTKNKPHSPTHQIENRTDQVLQHGEGGTENGQDGVEGGTEQRKDGLEDAIEDLEDGGKEVFHSGEDAVGHGFGEFELNVTDGWLLGFREFEQCDLRIGDCEMGTGRIVDVYGNWRNLALARREMTCGALNQGLRVSGCGLAKTSRGRRKAWRTWLIERLITAPGSLIGGKAEDLSVINSLIGLLMIKSSILQLHVGDKVLGITDSGSLFNCL